jgi:hypothetical protein
VAAAARRQRGRAAGSLAATVAAATAAAAVVAATVAVPAPALAPAPVAVAASAAVAAAVEGDWSRRQHSSSGGSEARPAVVSSAVAAEVVGKDGKGGNGHGLVVKKKN